MGVTQHCLRRDAETVCVMGVSVLLNNNSGTWWRRGVARASGARWEVCGVPKGSCLMHVGGWQPRWGRVGAVRNLDLELGPGPVVPKKFQVSKVNFGRSMHAPRDRRVRREWTVGPWRAGILAVAG